jgi:hypothetical protein
MRLSDAIALGRTVMTPKQGSFGDSESGCALGMAGKAAGLRIYDSSFPIEPLRREWPWLYATVQPYPCRCARTVQYHTDSLIIHLFDLHVMHIKDWTLDQLIDWVRSVEPAEPTESVEAAPQELVHDCV